MAMIRCCERLSLAAEMSSIALVILCVEETERMRRLMSCCEAMSPKPAKLDRQARFLFDVEDLIESLQQGVETGGNLVGELARLANLLQERALAAQLFAQLLLKARYLAGRDAVEEAVDAGVDRRHLLLGRPGLVLRLVERGHHPLAAGQRLQSRRIELGAELGEGLELAEGGEVEAFA